VKIDGWRIFNHMDVPMPWISALYDHDVEAFGDELPNT
jgi:hypothetical protein